MHIHQDKLAQETLPIRLKYPDVSCYPGKKDIQDYRKFSQRIHGDPPR